MLDFGTDICIWGAFWGILLQQKFTKGIISGEVKAEAWWKPFARAVVAVLTVSPALVLAFVLDKAAYLDGYAAMLFVTLTPSLYGSMCVFFLVDWINVKIGLLEMENDESKDISYESK